jgi:hypothetical protein
MAAGDFAVGWGFDDETRQVIVRVGVEGSAFDDEFRSPPLGTTEGVGSFIREHLDSLLEQGLITAEEYVTTATDVRRDFEKQGHRWESAS